MTSQLLATKTRIPLTRPLLVARHHLLQRLDDGLASGNRLFFVSAPAGYGKTTLLAHWLTRLRAECRAEASPLPAIHPAWLAVDQWDNDPARFLCYLGAALQQADTGLGQPLVSTIGLADMPSWSSMLPVFVNAIATLPDSVLLVLDDYHHISAQPVHDVVASLLEFMPPNLYLVISTRADPPLPLARLRGCGQITELRQNDLRFSATEAAEFLMRVMGLSLAQEHVTALTNRTEGWVAGLQMAAVSLQGRVDVAEFIAAFTGSHRHILDYLSEEVYRHQPADVRRFLVQTSILERFNASLCSVLTAPEAHAATSALEPPGVASIATQEAQRILEHLEHANLFVVPLDEDRHWYRYHHLLADLLRQRLDQEQPDAAPLLHLRASQWYEQQLLLHDAIRHALAAHHYDRAADLMERAAEVVMMSSEVATLRSWLESLPPTTLRAHPMLCVYEAGALLLAGESTEQVEARLRDALQNGGNGAVGGPAAVYRALMAAFQGRETISTRLAQHALELLPEHSPFFRSFAIFIMALNTLSGADDEVAIQRLREAQEMSDHVGNLMNSVLARCHLAELTLLRNRLDEAEQIFREALAVATEAGHPEPVSGFPLMGLGIIHYERNELISAQRCLEDGIDLVSGWGQLGAVQGRVVMAKVRRALGDTGGAEAILQLTEELLAHGSAPANMMEPYVLVNRVRDALQKEDLARADHYARAAGLTFDDFSTELTPPVTIARCFEQLVRGQLLSAHGRHRAAIQTFESLQRCAQDQGRERLVLLALLEQALVHHRFGHMEPAMAALTAALDLAAPTGSIRLFVDAGKPIADLLRLALRRKLHPEFTARLLAAFAAVPQASAAGPAPRGSNLVTSPTSTAIVVGAPAAVALESSALALSPRELQVLDLVAQGMTNQEIALRVTVAVSTVKTHINHICRKLDAPNRTAAVSRARHLHLLSQQ